MRFQRELLMVRLRLMADFNWRARVAKGPVGCKLEGRDELPVLAESSRSRLRGLNPQRKPVAKTAGPTTEAHGSPSLAAGPEWRALISQGCR